MNMNPLTIVVDASLALAGVVYGGNLTKRNLPKLRELW